VAVVVAVHVIEADVFGEPIHAQVCALIGQVQQRHEAVVVRVARHLFFDEPEPVQPRVHVAVV
jgi:hypothetical protein